MGKISAIAQSAFMMLLAMPAGAVLKTSGRGFDSVSDQVSQTAAATEAFSQSATSIDDSIVVSAAGSQVSLNGRLLSLPWQIRQQQIGLSDMDLLLQLGVDLLDTSAPAQQPIGWFSPESSPEVLTAWSDRQFRYLDIAALAARHGWQIQPSGEVLQIQTPLGEISNIRNSQQLGGDRIVIDLAQPTTLQLQQSLSEFSLTLDARASDTVVDAFKRNPQLSSLRLTSTTQQTILQGTISRDRQVRVWSLSNPDRWVIDIRLDPLVPRHIQWAAGLGWHQQVVSVAGRSFPVYWLEVDPKDPQIKIRPIWSDPVTVVGTAPLSAIARRWQATAAINAGFFNRNNRLPLGAIRSDGRWISGPILGRGAVGWTDAGEVLIDRLALRQTLITSAGERIALQGINTGYVQAGVGLYTPDWGSAYTPITGSETLVSVDADQVVRQVAASQNMATMIPLSGVLLAVRANLAIANQLSPGSRLTLETEVIPAAFDSAPYIASGGPLLLSHGTNVLNPQAESFSAAFANQAAPRSAIGYTATGQLLAVTVHLGPGGRGPTLSELSEIMRQLGCTDAVNLDGGSSSSLYLAGTLINRSPQTAARINNAIGIFFEP
ncbi:MAG: phosphodiester glycosidase family protein [Leptolyngbyaceae cyanobacterium SM1_1_3]|nr:phosphodiester glycosidase family protein [Leptolyngbyaceae cyanobacterium SM1_1_3]NJN02006.1 phosphodiester glycosidase family protein [Leptolyngbyaceae cyanobacterium RM1_1_2]